MSAHAQPSQPVRHAEKLLHFMNGLTEALEDEITLLEAHEYTRHPDILKRKQELTLSYQALLKLFNDSADKASLISPEEKAALQTRGKILEAVTLRNANALRIAQATSERLLQTMMNEMRKQVHTESGYANNAVLVAAQKGAMRPIAYNTRV